MTLAPGLLAAQVPDRPARRVDTGLQLPDQIGGMMAWLDARTLAITTYADPAFQFPWMIRRVVAFDLATATSRDLVPRGFLTCVNAEIGLVGIRRGDVRALYQSGAKSPQPVSEFLVWNVARRELVPAPQSATAGWNPSACLKPDAEDAKSENWVLGQSPTRYLQPQHGMLRWPHYYDPTPQTVELDDGRSSRPIDVKSNELAPRPLYLPFAAAYALRFGSYGGREAIGDPSPLLTMTVAGKVTRTPLPPRLKPVIDKAGGGATWLPVSSGTLVYNQSRPTEGGGLYLANEAGVRRVWCTPPDAALAYDFRCRIESSIEISPDGCKVAFASARSGRPDPSAPPTGLSGTVQIIDVCSDDTPRRR